VSEIATVGLLFAACSAVVVATGIRLSRYGDVIAHRTGLGGMWIGVLVMSAVTSLPELVSGASAIVLFQAPEIAVGDVAGSCLFNLAILAFLDFRHPMPLSARIHQGHILVAGFGLVQLGLAALAILAGTRGLAIGWIGVESLLFLAVHLLAIRMMFTAERMRLLSLPAIESGPVRAAAPTTLRVAIALYAVNAVLLMGAAGALSGLAKQLAQITGLAEGFVGSLFLAGATSMPEVVVSVAAARIGAVDLAVGNLFGSNVFNVAILGLDDALFLPGPLLSSVSRVHLVALVSAILMTAIAIIGVTYRAQRKRFRLSWEAAAMLAVYLAGLTLMWRSA
jgi:cation:H+ antiporter